MASDGTAEGPLASIIASAAFDFAASESRSTGLSTGVLCIHGFTGTPFEMRFLGQSLAERGMRVLGPCLPGHGTDLDDLEQTTWWDWYSEVEAGLETLTARCDRVAVVGHSMGGLLALHLARNRGSQLMAVASLAAPLWLEGLAPRVVAATKPKPGLSGVPARVLSRLLRRLPKLRGPDTRDPAMQQCDPGYDKVPLRALHQLFELMDSVRGELHGVTIPTLVLHAANDHVAPVASAHEIAARIPGAKLHILERSFHNIPIDIERAQVAASVGDFLQTHMGAASGSARSAHARG